MTDEYNMNRINPTSRACYTHEGGGVGGNGEVIQYLHRMSDYRVGPGTRFLDVGFGQGHDLIDALELGAAKVCGADIAQASIDYVMGRASQSHAERLDLRLLDVCHETLPWSDDYFDVAVCTEVPEHLGNLYFTFAEIKRVLKHDGKFLVAFPDYNDNGHGYEGGLHAHVYPGFLTPTNFQKFMWQLYFHRPRFRQNGSSSWFVYDNYKGEGINDTFHVIAGNKTEEQLYGFLDRALVTVEAW